MNLRVLSKMLEQKLKEAISILNKDKAQAMELFLVLKNDHPEDPQINYYLAACLSLCQDYMSAIKYLHKTVSLQGGSFNLYFNLGYCYRQIGNAIVAHYYLKKSIELSNMQDEGSLVVFASVLHELGGYEEALNLLKKAYQSNKKNKEIITTYLYLFGYQIGYQIGYQNDQVNLHRELLSFTEKQKNKVVSFALKHDFFRYNEFDSKIKQTAHINAFIERNKKSYYPESFILPENEKEFTNIYSKSKNIWLMKPDSLSGGAGIQIIEDIKDLKNKKCVVQKYIDNPYLLEGRKFNLRTFLVIAPTNPLEVYLWKEGVIYIAPEKFSLAKKDLSNKNIHIANMLISGKEAKADCSKFDSVLRFTKLLQLEFKNKDNIVYSNLVGLSEWLLSVIMNQGILAQQNYRCKGSSFMPKILGLDVTVDNDLNCWLTEVERYPGVGAGVFKERSEINMQFINEYWSLILDRNKSDSTKKVSTNNFLKLNII